GVVGHIYSLAFLLYRATRGSALPQVRSRPIRFRSSKIHASARVCPACRSANFRRSRRRTPTDYLLGFIGVLPGRCESCETRFRARRIPLREVIYAHCAICGNLELQRIAPEYVPGLAATVGRLLGFPALRCVPCRNKFFSIRPLRRETQKAATAP